jgi:hypothetical protein
MGKMTSKQYKFLEKFALIDKSNYEMKSRYAMKNFAYKINGEWFISNSWTIIKLVGFDPIEYKNAILDKFKKRKNPTSYNLIDNIHDNSVVVPVLFNNGRFISGVNTIGKIPVLDLYTGHDVMNIFAAHVAIAKYENNILSYIKESHEILSKHMSKRIHNNYPFVIGHIDDYVSCTWDTNEKIRSEKEFDYCYEYEFGNTGKWNQILATIDSKIFDGILGLVDNNALVCVRALFDKDKYVDEDDFFSRNYSIFSHAHGEIAWGGFRQIGIIRDAVDK